MVVTCQQQQQHVNVVSSLSAALLAHSCWGAGMVHCLACSTSAQSAWARHCFLSLPASARAAFNVFWCVMHALCSKCNHLICWSGVCMCTGVWLYNGACLRKFCEPALCSLCVSTCIMVCGCMQQCRHGRGLWDIPCMAAVLRPSAALITELHA